MYDKRAGKATYGGGLSKRLTRRIRLIKVYLVLARVISSYLGLTMAGWLLGKRWLERRLPRKHRLNARRVERVILHVKGLFIKVGQLISILTNFLPEEFRGELEGVQDQVPPSSLEDIEIRIREELGREPGELFASFNSTPIASASLAQVHEARLRDGRRIALKIQHRDIEETAAIDLDTIRRVLAIAGFITRLRGLDTAYRQVREMILEELDFGKEADHIEAITTQFEDDPMVSCPEVVREFTTRRILATLLIEGPKITDIQAIEDMGLDRKVLAERVLSAYCRMLFNHGLYHADPHPGNILVRPGGEIVFIDFGAVGRLSTRMKEGIPRLLEAVLRRDSAQIQQALQDMGFISRDADDASADRLITYLQRRFLEQMPIESWSLKDIHVDLQAKVEVMADIRDLDISFRDLMSTFQVPKEWVLLHRTLLLLMGLATHLDPEMKPMKTIRPYLKEVVLGRGRDWTSLATAMIRNLFLTAITIPDDLKRCLAGLNSGELEIRVQGTRERSRLLYALGHQVLFGLLALGSGVLAYVAWTRGDVLIARWSIGIGGFFAVCLGGSLLSARKWL